MVVLGPLIWVGGSLLVTDRSTPAASGDTIQRPGAAVGKNDSLRAANVGMSTPAGYTAQQMIFDDQFSGTTLDATKWMRSWAQGTAWNDNGTSLRPTPDRTPPSLRMQPCTGLRGQCRQRIDPHRDPQYQ